MSRPGIKNQRKWNDLPGGSLLAILLLNLLFLWGHTAIFPRPAIEREKTELEAVISTNPESVISLTFLPVPLATPSSSDFLYRRSMRQLSFYHSTLAAIRLKTLSSPQLPVFRLFSFLPEKLINRPTTAAVDLPTSIPG